MRPAAPVPDIKANGQDGPITLATSDNLVVTVSMNAAGGSYKCDWWVVMADPARQYFYYNLSSQTFQPGLNVTYQGALMDLGNFQVFNFPFQTEGTYTFYFWMDGMADGSVSYSFLYYDSVTVIAFFVQGYFCRQPYFFLSLVFRVSVVNSQVRLFHREIQ